MIANLIRWSLTNRLLVLLLSLGLAFAFSAGDGKKPRAKKRAAVKQLVPTAPTPAPEEPTAVPEEPTPVPEETAAEEAEPAADAPVISQPIYRWGEVADKLWVLVGYGDASNPTVVQEGTVITAAFSSDRPGNS